ncbi:hypothetical protein [Chryseobacterium nematophagum]|uniref:hypothetical protein n=1 Tax=Chryseobacterium nematophagum TaxID=2305228 RepID=UPI001604F004|nr:hypothetical protein [Chryseobacterium nematophagum]
METPNHNLQSLFNEVSYTIEWADIENIEIDPENDLNALEAFFKQDFENDPLEEDLL